MFDPIDIIMLFGAAALVGKALSDNNSKKDRIKEHKKLLKKLEDKEKKLKEEKEKDE